MDQNVVLQVCELERSRSSMKVKLFLSDLRHLLISTQCEVSWKFYNQFFWYGRAIIDQKVARNKKKRKKERKNKQMFVKHLPPARSEYRVPQRPITKTGTKEGQLTQRYY